MSFVERTVVITYQDWLFSDCGRRPLIIEGEKECWLKEAPVFNPDTGCGYCQVKALVEEKE